jgi:ParB/RepB/Spo0J family partition protein
MNETLGTIRIDAIRRNEAQPRQEFDKEKLEDLARSLEDKGLLQPITVRPVLIFKPCHHHIAPRTEQEMELWSCLLGRASRSSATPPDCSMEKAASGYKPRATDTSVPSHRAKSTTVSRSAYGCNPVGVSAESIASGSAGVSGERSTISGIGTSTAPDEFAFYSRLYCPICASREKRPCEHSRSFLQTPDIDGSPRRTVSSKPTGAFSQKVISHPCSAERSRPSGIAPAPLVSQTNDATASEFISAAYCIVAGERRFRAAQLAGWETIPALVRDLTDDEAYELAVLENAVREDLNPMEEAKMLAKLLARPMSLQEVGALVGLPASQITWRVALLNLREDVQYLIGRGQMKPGVAYYMAKLTLNSQARVLRIWQEKGLGDDGVRGVCDQIWMEENQADMMPETKLSDGARQAVAA